MKKTGKILINLTGALIIVLSISGCSSDKNTDNLVEVSNGINSTAASPSLKPEIVSEKDSEFPAADGYTPTAEASETIGKKQDLKVSSMENDTQSQNVTQKPNESRKNNPKINSVNAKIPVNTPKPKADKNIGAQKQEAVHNTAVPGYKDGVYQGKGKGWGGDMVVKVNINGGKIAGIEVESHKETPQWADKTFGPVIGSIIKTQSTNVDIVSGATYSSKGLIDAVKDAIGK
jgi:uncharacterized protein with FMN-binding domain